MTYLERARKIAYLILHLKHELRPLKRELGGLRGNLSDQALAQLLNAAQGSRKGAVHFDAKKVNDIWNAKALNLSSVEHTKILQALQLLVIQRKLPINVEDEFPIWLEEKYSEALPEIFRERALPRPQGEHLGSLATTLARAWQFFYVRPVDNEGRPQPEIRCQIAVFGRARPESTATSFLMISAQHQWRGHAVLHEPHLYVTCTEERGADSSFIVINAPKRADDFLFAGVAVALIKPPRRHTPLAAVVCFGQPVRTEALSEQQAIAITQAIESGQVSRNEQARLRSIVKDVAYKSDELAQFNADYPTLSKYMDAMEINGAPNQLLQSLFVRWP